MGGPMMGYRMPAMTVPVVKATNCVIAASPALFPPPPAEQACIRCGDCARACPADLQPFELYWHARSKNFGKAQEYHLFDCIECGCCSYVCPSHIPLVDYFRFGKSEIWARERQKEDADAARLRFEFRNERLEHEKQEKAARLAARTATRSEAPAASVATATREPAENSDEAAKKALIAAAMARAKQRAAGAAAADTAPADVATAVPAAPSAEDTKKALIAAAMARAQAQRAAVSARNTEDLNAAQQAQIDAADARRATAASSNQDKESGQ
jgi:Na+-translocating ferredoxin:NAD+ oxidoreductase subunit C